MTSHDEVKQEWSIHRQNIEFKNRTIESSQSETPACYMALSQCLPTVVKWMTSHPCHPCTLLLTKQFKSMNPLPYMYGLPKTHNENCLLRRIIYNEGRVAYKLSKRLVKHLSPALGSVSPSRIKSSQDFMWKDK